MKQIYINESDLIENQLWWQKQRLTKTASGYGTKLPSIYKLKYVNRLRRVYYDLFSNSGAFYILVAQEKIYLTIQ